VGRRSVWSDPEVKRLAEKFVPAADEVGFLQRRPGPEGDLFRKVAEQGHYAGRMKPTDTRQGIYATAPNGTLLASVNSNDPRRMQEMLEKALAAWGGLPREARLPEAALEKSPKGRFRWESLYPEDGLALRVNSRDLERPSEGADWRAHAWNQDYAWFRRDEARAFVPAEPKPGAKTDVPSALVRRLARCHLVDDVRGQTPPFEDAQVERATLSSEVVSVSDGKVTLRLSGETRAVARGRWAVSGFADMNAPQEHERGYEARLLGKATWDLASARFTSFELLAVGPRWGATQYNGRSDDPGPAPMGVAFTLAGATPSERVAPASIWAYGWR
jgi:hypothetical protein